MNGIDQVIISLWIFPSVVLIIMPLSIGTVRFIGFLLSRITRSLASSGGSYRQYSELLPNKNVR